jgi:hypothetical protein
MQNLLQTQKVASVPTLDVVCLWLLSAKPLLEVPFYLYRSVLFSLENNYFTEMCIGSEAGSHLRGIDSVDHSTLGLSVIKKISESFKRVVSRLKVLRCTHETSYPGTSLIRNSLPLGTYSSI